MSFRLFLNKGNWLWLKPLQILVQKDVQSSESVHRRVARTSRSGSLVSLGTGGHAGTDGECVSRCESTLDNALLHSARDCVLLSSNTHFQFVCTGGTAGRMQEFAELCLEAFSVDGPVGVGLTDLCGPHARYVMYKAGPVLAVSVSFTLFAQNTQSRPNFRAKFWQEMKNYLRINFYLIFDHIAGKTEFSTDRPSHVVRAKNYQERVFQDICHDPVWNDLLIKHYRCTATSFPSKWMPFPR